MNKTAMLIQTDYGRAVATVAVLWYHYFNPHRHRPALWPYVLEQLVAEKMGYV